MPYLRPHQPSLHFLPCPGGALRLHPTQLTGPPKLLIMIVLYEWLVLTMLHNCLNTRKQATASFSEPPPPYLFLSSPRPSTSSRQARFTAWLHLRISKPYTSSSHLRLLYSSCRVAPRRTQVGADLDMNHPGNPKTSALSGQLQTTSEHHHPASAQLILHGGQRLVVSGHSHSLQLH